MKKVIVASKNPVKVDAAQRAFQQVFPQEQFEVQGLQVPSFVAEQPMSDAETLEGAINRAENAKLAMKNADYWVGIEGGIETNGVDMDAFGWIVVLSKKRLGQARSCTFPLPPYVAKAVLAGKELGHVNDEFFKMHNSKQGGGAVGSLTDNLVTRMDLYVQPLILALIPFLQEKLFEDFEQQ
ncbi:MAG: inosine/xanthosine triphosphatase [Bacteroidota bacterium]